MKWYTVVYRVLLCTIVSCIVLSCNSDAPPAVEETPPPRQIQTPAAVFDPTSISQEDRDAVMAEIRQLIQELNGIIRAQNYNAWVSFLAPDYYAQINSPEFLHERSQSPAMRTRNIVLRTSRDYFTHVVVPSRANDRVDDIEFVTSNRVNAFTVNNAGNRLRLYGLERFGTEWKIVN